MAPVGSSAVAPAGAFPGASPGASAAGPASAASCASGPAQDDSAKLALYRSHAGAPVPSFHFFGRLDSWTPLGDSAVAVWTRPNEAYLLTLFGPCNGLEFTPFIGLTSSVGTVSARFDKVLVRDTGSINMPCTIQQIQPLDVKIGDRILFGKWSGTEIKIAGEDMLIMKESDVMGILEGRAEQKKAA